MRLGGLTYSGAPLDDPAILSRLPENLAKLLQQMNGLVALRGAFHLRGACLTPSWHSLRTVMEGPFDLRSAFAGLKEGDVPFAEDCLGNQFLLRGRKVFRLDLACGDVASMGGGLKDFLLEVAARPEQLVNLALLDRFEQAGGVLRPGRSLQLRSGTSGASLRSIPGLELVRERGLELCLA